MTKKIDLLKAEISQSLDRSIAEIKVWQNEELKMTPPEGQALSLLKKHLIEGIQTRMETDWPEINRRLRIGEAADWIRANAPGRALEVLEGLLADYEAQDRKGH